MNEMMSYLHKNPYQPEEELEDPIELMTENLLKIKNEITSSKHQQNQLHIQAPNSIREQVVEEYTPQINQNDIILKEYQSFLEGLPQEFSKMSYEQKIRFLVKQTDPGALVYLFQIIYHFREALNEQLLVEIAQTVTHNICYENQVELRCSIELLGLLGVIDENMIQVVSKMMLEEQIPFDLAFLYLINMGYLGLYTLMDIANKDFNDIPLEILDYLSRSQNIISEIIIPTVFADLVGGDSKKKTIALAILNRLNGLMKDPKFIFALEKMLEEGVLDRGLIASTLRSTGDLGEEILLRQLRSQNNKLKLPIISVLPWKVPEEPNLAIKVIQYSIGGAFIPGSMYRYEGSTQPLAYCPQNSQETECEDQLLINSRDFMAALHRLLNSKFHEFENQSPLRDTALLCKGLFLQIDIIKQKEEDQKNEDGEGNITISHEVIKSLSNCLGSSIVEIRQASLNALGVIGLPEGFDAVQKVIKCLSDPDSRNRSMACWTISKISQNPSQKIIKKLVQLLKDNYWKVRTAACIALGTIVKTPNQQIIESLLKVLKDGTINKNTVCETMIHLGSIGQEILVELLKHTRKSQFKLKAAIINSFKFADVTQPSIDFLIEQLFKHCNDENIQVRSLCLQSLNHLRLKSRDENITYLKAKNILPLFYFFLQDSNQKLRDLAVDAILSFGSQAELIFIEGLTKSQNALVRAQSAKGLCKLGVQNFRAIIFGLRDQDQRVRKCTSNSILTTFSKQSIINEFKKKQNQIPSLLCHLRDILVSNNVSSGLKTLFEDLLKEFDPHRKSTRVATRMSTINNNNKQNEDSNNSNYSEQKDQQ